MKRIFDMTRAVGGLDEDYLADSFDRFKGSWGRVTIGRLQSGRSYVYYDGKGNQVFYDLYDEASSFDMTMHHSEDSMVSVDELSPKAAKVVAKCLEELLIGAPENP